MEGLKVKCTTCGGVLHETTDKYDPNKTLNGSMVRLIYPNCKHKHDSGCFNVLS
jgi:hypothetical protein